MRIGFGCTHDVVDWVAARDQGIGDQGAVAAPGDGLGAHDGDGFGGRSVGQGFEGGLKFGGLHVIGITAEGLVAPSGIG